MRFGGWVLLGFVCMTGVCAWTEENAPMQPWAYETVFEILAIRDDFHPIPTYQDREAWERMINEPALKDALDGVVKAAHELAGQDPPRLRASLYLDFQRTGQRRSYESAMGRQSEFVNTFALAECLEGKGEFLDPLMDALWTVCEMSDWCMPAHTKGLPDMEMPHIDLGASQIGVTLGEVTNVFGDALPEPVRKRIDYEMNRRIFEPYLMRDFNWVTGKSNWNAVCNGNLLRAALYFVHDRERLAKIVHKAQNGLVNYLQGFGRDGGTAEGIGYWNYGFSRYVYAALLLNQYTDKKLNLLEPPIVKEIAQFPSRIEMSMGKYPTFSDSGESNSCPVAMMSFLSDELGLPQLRSYAAARLPETKDVGSLPGLFYGYLIAELPQPKPGSYGWEPYHFLRGVEWMIARVDSSDPASLVLVAKGGRNDEPHNHNDVGNFIVHCCGESLIVDMGAPVYERDFFRSDKRYSFLSARSLGHSVPLVNGLEQRVGSFAAKSVNATHTPGRDTLRSDIAEAYPPEAGLNSLVREISLVRQGKGQIELIDRASFKDVPTKYESALMTFGRVDTGQPGIVTIQGENAGLRIEYDANAWKVAVTDYSSAEAKLRVVEKYPTIRRIAFQCLQPAKEIELAVRILPVE